MTAARQSWEYICALNSCSSSHHACLLAFLLCCSLLLLLGAYSTSFILLFTQRSPPLQCPCQLARAQVQSSVIRQIQLKSPIFPPVGILALAHYCTYVLLVNKREVISLFSALIGIFTRRHPARNELISRRRSVRFTRSERLWKLRSSNNLFQPRCCYVR